MLKSVECTSPQQYSGTSLVFIHCVVVKIELFFLIPSCKASCLSHLMGITPVSQEPCNIKILDLYNCGAEDLWIPLISES